MAPINSIVTTSDGKWRYTFTGSDAARFGGNKPSDYISRNICIPKNATTDVDNGAGDRLRTTFTGDWNYCDGMVKVAEDWQSWQGTEFAGSWYLYHDIQIFDDHDQVKATLSL